MIRNENMSYEGALSDTSHHLTVHTTEMEARRMEGGMQMFSFVHAPYDARVTYDAISNGYR